MATNLKNESLFALQMYLQFLSDVNTDLFGFHEQRKKDQELKKVGKSYIDDLEIQIGKFASKHNDLRDEIEKVITDRIRKKFPQVISEAKKRSLLKDLETELHKNAPKVEKAVRKLEITKSREKKVNADIQEEK